MDKKKYKVINPDNPNFGKKIDGVVTVDSGSRALMVTDVRTGRYYNADEVREVPERHAAYMGVNIGRVGLFLFAREYCKYYSCWIGCGIDCVKFRNERNIDVETRIMCFGIGLRISILKKNE